MLIWRLQKRVLNFVHVPPPHCGVDIVDAIYKCLKECGLKNKVFTVSMDNASYNHSCLRFLREIFSRNRRLLCKGKLFHVRCCAHILNLLVQDGLGEIGHIIENVRESVKYINQYEARKQTFSKIVQQLQLGTKKLVIIDFPTRWNSTFQMLLCALKFKDVFPRFQGRKPNYDYLSTPEEWKNVEKVCEVLEVFNVVTNIIFDSDYPTSNFYLSEIYRVKEILNLKAMDESDFIRRMVGKMKGKFDKYWGECNLLMVVASVMDPRCKLRLAEMFFPKIYSEAETRNNIEQVRGDLYQLYMSM
ncbi:PREDICTED: zinc finger BED domain-containing protein RICESLEEPER 2-like [Nelumbo nucifera]|uniref:Zinc finger BED domain-containing protein RICESLEEPER 2-like n=1 Tax=Nelumbo nucifera TaxID=4432 RepID=A0A1U7ZA41_NELNU|nr:PREDICTED: zinc finger BED domain-containing protein RICESLEEPER 2-like [Nelumbo nucifera]